jgi:hypothetical protein
VGLIWTPGESRFIMNTTSIFDIKRIKLDILKAVQHRAISRGLMCQIDFLEHFDYITDSLVVGLQAFLASNTETTKEEFDGEVTVEDSWNSVFGSVFRLVGLVSWGNRICPKHTYSTRKVVKVTKICPHLPTTDQRTHLEFFIT